MTLQIETLLVGPLDVNCYIVGCDVHNSCAVVDPGDSPKLILETISRRGWKVEVILNTHGHADHTGANRRIKEATAAPLAIHSADQPLLTHEHMTDMAAYLGVQTSPEPDTLLEDGSQVSLCPCSALRVIHTPGHSPGGACFYHDGFVIAGDTIFRMSIGRSDLPGGNHEALISSIRSRLFTLPDDTVIYPGHGDPTSVGFEKRHNPFTLDGYFR